MRRALVVILFFGGLVGLWQLATVSARWSPVLLPPPLAILDYLWGALRDGTLLEATGVTLYRLLIGYLIGIRLAYRSPEAEAYLERKGCEVLLKPTPEPIRMFNRSGAKRIGLFHVTC
jgi:hypothetical protein